MPKEPVVEKRDSLTKHLDRPNILIITTDQQRVDSLSCYGSDFTDTPNLDRLAAEGVRLNRAYCTNPVCTPSRVSIFTGKQVGRHGVWNVGVNCPENETMISHILADVGYRTHYVGKAHFQAFLAPAEQSREGHQYWKTGYGDWYGPYYGFETAELALGHVTYGLSGHYGAWVRDQVSQTQVKEWEKARQLSEIDFGGQAYDWSIPLKYHNSVWTADRTIAFLRAHDPTQPFLLAVGFQDPHHPHAVPAEFTDRVAAEDVPPPDFTPGELDDKPPHFLEAHLGKLEQSAIRGKYYVAGQGPGRKFYKVSAQEARLGRAYYYTMVKLIDREVGRILTTLDELGMADNTLVIFTSDHGELLGDHGLWLKGPFVYEQLIRVPTIIRWPRGIKGGQTTSALFSLADIVPTCLTAAAVATPEDVDGVNALSLLRGEATSIRDEVLVETVDDPARLRSKTIVTDTRKLTWYAGQTYGELFDLANDPAERINHWDNPAYHPDKIKLLARLLDYAEAIEPRWPRYTHA